MVYHIRQCIKGLLDSEVDFVVDSSDEVGGLSGGLQIRGAIQSDCKGMEPWIPGLLCVA